MSNTQARTANRVPPHNLDAEASLLGAMLLSREAVGVALERGVHPDEFYKPGHRHIYDAIRSLNTSGEPKTCQLLIGGSLGSLLINKTDGFEYPVIVH